jgi:hypothetical protein
VSHSKLNPTDKGSKDAALSMALHAMQMQLLGNGKWGKMPFKRAMPLAIIIGE